jgi:hypothetical protein
VNSKNQNKSGVTCGFENKQQTLTNASWGIGHDSYFLKRINKGYNSTVVSQ